MHSLLLPAICSALFALPFTGVAQSARPVPATERLALAAPPASAAARLECSRFTGQVLNAEGQPLVGATVTLVGGRIPYITNSEGKYIITEPVYRGQKLRVAAAGYVDRELPMTSCEAPIIGLELAEGTRIKRSGKRAGQIVRFGQAYRQ
ncbi:carboxypeptidase-like regulatory domain-containing protein [Hymenobacter sp. HSC-4F20]|uniref:carboxypeptidase-like regulatory domain-containing protein n=1 Tax=Hymenobacter sp. HSC-4F20 TaxID=2864135 RepID=UPI001C72B0BF|nr:carboxypeptidase-like regulatory domain-containing protein [Hymenobacter sp. HSC-4F20]MBX0292612.1 carboxypeptidase-like regulatory domain-containing protein [Hymenobacter sp. HSC-4F20]